MNSGSRLCKKSYDNSREMKFEIWFQGLKEQM